MDWQADQQVQQCEYLQRVAPADVLHAQVRQRNADRAGKTGNQRKADDGALVGIAKGLAQHHEGRVVQRGRHGDAHR